MNKAQKKAAGTELYNALLEVLDGESIKDVSDDTFNALEDVFGSMVDNRVAPSDLLFYVAAGNGELSLSECISCF